MLSSETLNPAGGARAWEGFLAAAVAGLRDYRRMPFYASRSMAPRAPGGTLALKAGASASWQVAMGPNSANGEQRDGLDATPGDPSCTSCLPLPVAACGRGTRDPEPPSAWASGWLSETRRPPHPPPAGTAVWGLSAENKCALCEAVAVWEFSRSSKVCFN